MNFNLTLLGALVLATMSGCDAAADEMHILAPSPSNTGGAGAQPSTFYVVDSGFVHLAIGSQVTIQKSRTGVHPLRQSRNSLVSTSWTVRDTTVARLAGERLTGRAQGHTWLVWAEGSAVDSTMLVVSPAPVGYLTPRSASLETKGAGLTLKGPAGDSAVTFTYSGAPSATVSSLGQITPLSEKGAGVVRGRSQGNRTMAAMVVVLQGVVAEDPDPETPPEPPVTPETPVPPTDREVPLRLHRFAGAEASTVTSSAVPLPPGWAKLASVDSISLRVNGVEVPVHVAALYGKHADGSVRSVLVQADITPEMVSGGATLAIGAKRTRIRARLDTVPLPNKSGVLLPFDPDYLVSTLVVGKTVSRATAQTWPTVFGQFESKFDEMQAHHWNARGDNWTENFYDRALAFFAFWVRTGNPVFWERGSRLAVNYRQTYLEANNYGAAEWWTKLEGLTAHYWLTGDGASRTAVFKTAESLHRGRGGPQLANIATHPWMDNRVQAKVLGSKVMSLRLEALPFGVVTDWQGMVRTDLTRILSTQAVDGAYRFHAACRESVNFMGGMLGSALIEYYEHFEPDARIPTAIRRNMEFMRSSQWLPAHQVFNYYSGPCAPEGGTGPANDLNGMYLESMGWLAHQTGDDSWIAFGDLVLRGLMAKTWFHGPKQFNQAYQLSWRYHWYRDQP